MDGWMESRGSSNDVKMKRAFETAECEAVRNSIGYFWAYCIWNWNL